MPREKQEKARKTYLELPPDLLELGNSFRVRNSGELAKKFKKGPIRVNSDLEKTGRKESMEAKERQLERRMAGR